MTRWRQLVLGQVLFLAGLLAVTALAGFGGAVDSTSGS
jgi:hypothetical protein